MFENYYNFPIIRTMTKKQQIKQLVQFAITDKTTTNKIISIGILTVEDVALIKAKTGFDLTGY